jgi:hypothetical protein
MTYNNTEGSLSSSSMQMIQCACPHPSIGYWSEGVRTHDCAIPILLGHMLNVVQSFVSVLFMVCGWEKLSMIVPAASGIVGESVGPKGWRGGGVEVENGHVLVLSCLFCFPLLSMSCCVLFRTCSYVRVGCYSFEISTCKRFNFFPVFFRAKNFLKKTMCIPITSFKKIKITKKSHLWQK